MGWWDVGPSAVCCWGWMWGVGCQNVGLPSPHVSCPGHFCWDSATWTACPPRSQHFLAGTPIPTGHLEQELFFFFLLVLLDSQYKVLIVLSSTKRMRERERDRKKKGWWKRERQGLLREREMLYQKIMILYVYEVFGCCWMGSTYLTVGKSKGCDSC